jgi:hypothetical protein
VTIHANGTLTYTQTIFASGVETFTYTISDGHGGTDTAIVTVTVNLPAKIGIDMLLSQVKRFKLCQKAAAPTTRPPPRLVVVQAQGPIDYVPP